MPERGLKFSRQFKAEAVQLVIRTRKPILPPGWCAAWLLGCATGQSTTRR